MPSPPPHYSGAAQLTVVPMSGVFQETNNTIKRFASSECPLALGEGTYCLKDELTLAVPPPNPTDLPLPSINPLDITRLPRTSGTLLSLATSHDTARQSSHARDDRNGSLQRDDPDNSKQLLDGSASSKDQSAIKRRKPKSGVVKSSSSFIARVIVADDLPRWLAEGTLHTHYAIANIGRSLHWLDLSSNNKVEPLTRLYFAKANVLCHAINPFTRTASHLDVIAGFNTSDVIWYEPFSQKYTRLNKNGIINPSLVTAIQWLPNSETRFIAAHEDGVLIIYDKEKDDAVLLSEEQALPTSRLTMKVIRSLSATSKTPKTNPVAVWQISLQAPNALSFSPDGEHLAVACEDGTLRIINHTTESCRDIFRSYYGGMTSVAWSPDGEYILTGGQDDLVSIWSMAERSLVARCQGHTAWVTDVKFDPWRCDERGYRFGSVGQDCTLLLWDFSIGMLRKSKAVSVRHRDSVESAVDQSAGKPSIEADDDVFHAVESRLTTAVLPPVMVRSYADGLVLFRKLTSEQGKQVDTEPLIGLVFARDAIMTTSRDGHIRTWTRPV